MNKVKLLEVILNGKPFGGAEKHVLELTTGLADLNYEVDVVCSKGNDIAGKLRKVQGVGSVIEIERGLGAIFKLAKIIKKIKPRVVHLHGPRAAVLGRIASLLHNKDYFLISTCHGWILEYKKFNRLLEIAYKYTAVLEDLTIAVSHGLLKQMRSKGYKQDNIVVIHNGIDLSKFSLGDKRKKTNTLTFGFVGRLTGQKGIKYMLEAIKKVKGNSNSNIPRFIICGTGELSEYVKKFIFTENLADCIEYKGFIPPEKVAYEMAQFNCTLVPSIDEPFGYVVVESMAVGTPVIASSIGGIPELIIDGRTGVLVQPKSVDCLAETILSFTNNPESLELMRISCVERAQEYSIQKMVKKVNDIIVSNL